MALLLGPSPKQMEAILSDLGETDDRFEANVKDLQNWISYQPHLPKNCDSHMLGLFVRGCKHDRARARRKLERFWCARATQTDFYVGRNLADYALALNFMEMVPLPRLTADGCRVTLHRVRPPPAADAPWTALDVVRFSLAIGDVRLSAETVIAGDVFVYDLGALRAAACARLASPVLRRALALAHDAYPQRLQRVHLLNAPSFMAGLLALIRSCMKEKMRNRFMLHTSIDSLHEHIDASILPRDYGGEEPPLSELQGRWLAALERAAPMRDQLAARATVTRHAAATAPDYDVGAFRRLNID